MDSIRYSKIYPYYMPAEEVIATFGGVHDLEKALKSIGSTVGTMTIYKWRERGVVPGSAVSSVVAAYGRSRAGDTSGLMKIIRTYNVKGKRK